MSYISLVNNSEFTLLTDQLVFSTNDIDTLKSVTDTSQHLTDLLANYKARIRVAEQEGFAKGVAEGRAEGVAQAQAEVARQLTQLAVEAQHQRKVLKASSSRLAIQIVKKIADGLGPAEMVAAIAKSAVDELVPNGSLKLRVHPDVVESVEERLARVEFSLLQIEVRADESLQPFDCLLSTDLGVTVANLDHQLDCLQRVLEESLSQGSSL